MSIEEKAKAYDEALERAKAYHRNELAGSRKEMTEYIFPELRESEDEKVMKNIRLALLSVDDAFWRTHEIIEKEALAYLEKQKEQKPIEDIVKDITKNKESAIKFLKSAGIMDDNGELAEMYRSEQKLVTFNEPYNPDEYEAVMEGNATSLKRKEQKPVDYDHEMWKNCEVNFEGGKKEVINHPEKYGLQKPVGWSEEDKDYYDTIVRKLEVIGDDSGLSNNQIKFLREHCPLHCLEWSDEDKTIIEGACSALEIYGHFKLADKLKSLRPQPHWKPSEEQMEALETAERWYSDNMGCNFALVSLCEQLKKL